ncbi:MAG: phosphoenolpyruvate--protein phosphotransferase [Lachnospiraceae bacterium]|nr:phosphoenolpyruvate--protein phosphotransferase [Lachnospiraceae bacterium]
MSTVFFGSCISSGHAAGPLFYRRDTAVSSACGCDPAAEQARFQEALRLSDRELSDAYERIAVHDPAFAEIFSAHRTLLRDPLFLGAVEEKINAGFSAASALNAAEETLSETLKNAEEERASAFLYDLSDAVRRLSFYLSGGGSRLPESGRFILYTEEIALGALVFEHEKIAGIACMRCDPASHGAILARSYGIPVLSGIILPDMQPEGAFAVLDADKKTLTLTYGERREAEEILPPKEETEELPPLPEGMKLYGNAASLMEALKLPNGKAEGIGLFRSEFSYMGRTEPPGEEMLYLEYRRLMESLRGYPVTIRTADLRLDKQVSFGSPEGLLRTQLRALYRAAGVGDLRILFPMVKDAADFRRLRTLAEEVCREVSADAGGPGHSRKEVPLGAMIETLGAVREADAIAREASFLSIGSNDLLRELKKTDPDADRGDVLSLLPGIAKAAKDAGIPVTICGELARDSEKWPSYKEIGIDAVSVQL